MPVKESTRICAICQTVIVNEPGWFKCECGFSFSLKIVGDDPLLMVQVVQPELPRGMPA